MKTIKNTPVSEEGQSVAVIDVGSNSIRLVVYEGLKRALIPIFNEKILCGLAKNMEKTGHLDPGGRKRALAVLDRFITLATVMGVDSLTVFATSAVRDAQDGADFVAQVQSCYKCEVTVLAAEDEAYYSALGVINSIDNVHGFVGDLGGGSLELVWVDHGNIAHKASFPIGTLRLIHGKEIKIQHYIASIDYHIASFFSQHTMENCHFYLVGGSFRSLVKMHMMKKHYPIKVLHNYVVQAEEFYSTLQIVARSSWSTLKKTKVVPKKRLSLLPIAALVAERIIFHGRPSQVVCSTSGVREGVLMSQLTEQQKTLHPLIAACIEMAKKVNRSSQYGYELMQWVSPLFAPMTPECKNLMLAACLLSDICCYENTEYRAELAFKKIMDSSLIGVTHKERIYIAAALYYRYKATLEDEYMHLIVCFLSKKDQHEVALLGAAMKLARNISASSCGVLSNTPVMIKGKTVYLQLQGTYAALKGEAVEKRLRSLAAILKLEYEISS